MHCYPVHAELHTVLGASLVSIATIIFALPTLRFTFSHILLPIARLVSNSHMDKMVASAVFPSRAAIVIGAVTGAINHLLLDGIIHDDMKPLFPLTNTNPFLVSDSFIAMHIACATIGTVGLAMWAISTNKKVG